MSVDGANYLRGKLQDLVDDQATKDAIAQLSDEAVKKLYDQCITAFDIVTKIIQGLSIELKGA